MRKPKNQARSADRTKAAQREAIANQVLETAPELQAAIAEMDKTEESKASNVLLLSEQPKPKRTTLTLKRPGSKALQKPIEASTAEEAKPATPVAKKTKAKPLAPAKPSKPDWLPDGAEEIKRGEELVGYVAPDGKGFFDALDLKGKRVTFSTKKDRAREVYLQKLPSDRQDK